MPGLLGGPLPLLALRTMDGGARVGWPGSLWPSDCDGPGIDSLTARWAMGGALLELVGRGLLEGGGTLDTRGGPARGGGGVAVLASAASEPPFLLIHRFNSGS